MTLPRAVIFDLDGTLANTEHRDHLIGVVPGAPGGYAGASEVQKGVPQPDWQAYAQASHQDSPLDGPLELARILWKAGHHLILISGRNVSAQPMTQEWLADHLMVPYVHLWMRKAGDFRNNVTLKLDYLVEARKWYTIVLLVDDHPGVIAAFAEEGIPGVLVARNGVAPTHLKGEPS